jgi:hypothetical protein
MSLLISPLFPIAIDLIHKFARGINPLIIERQSSEGRQTETEERPGGCNGLSQNHSKLVPEFPNPKHYVFHHQPSRVKRHFTQDPGLSLAILAEFFRIEGREGKLAMRRWKVDIEKWVIMDMTLGCFQGKELVFRQI